MSASVKPLERLLHIACHTFKVSYSRDLPPPNHAYLFREAFVSEEHEFERVFKYDNSAHLMLCEKEPSCKILFATDAKRDDYLVSVSVHSTDLEKVACIERIEHHTFDDLYIANEIKMKAQDMCGWNLYCSENITYPIDVRIPAKHMDDVSAALFLRYFGPVRKRITSVVPV